MATMNISLPDSMKDFVEQRASNGRYANVSDYVRELIRRDEEGVAYKQWLNAEIQKGYDRGFSEMTIDDAFSTAHKRAKAMLAKKDVA